MHKSVYLTSTCFPPALHKLPESSLRPCDSDKAIAHTQWRQVRPRTLIDSPTAPPQSVTHSAFPFILTTRTVPTDLRPIVISGPSGVGKGTLYKLLLDRHPSLFATSVSHTTRDPRPGETRDVDYYYITMAEFEKMIEEKAFVENAKFGGNRYGTSKRTIGELTASGKVVVLDIEMEVCLSFFAFLCLALPARFYTPTS
jgi:Guanylate kinase